MEVLFSCIFVKTTYSFVVDLNGLGKNSFSLVCLIIENKSVKLDYSVVRLLT